MADPLTLLRTYIVNKKEIIIEDNNIMFDDLSWPKTVNTNFFAYGSGKNGEPKKYYTLECLLYLLKNSTLRHVEYVRQAANENVPIVRRPNRKELLAYLNGELSTATSIDRSAPLEIPTQIKRSAVEDVQESVAKKPRMEDTLQVRGATREVDTPKESTVNIDNIKSLSEAMSVEKIAAIKAKRLAKKHTTIKSHDDVGLGSGLRVMLDFDVDISKDIIKREREYQSRNTILQSNGKVFGKNIFAILQSIKKREDERSHSTHIMSVTPRVAPTKPTILQTIVCSRYDQGGLIKSKKNTEYFKIDTMGTYDGMTLSSVTEESIPKKPVATVTPVRQSSTTGSHEEIHTTIGDCNLSSITENDTEIIDYIELMNTPKHSNTMEDKEKQMEILNSLALRRAKLQLELVEMEYNIMVSRQDTEKKLLAIKLKQIKIKEQILQSKLEQNKMKEFFYRQLIDNL